jgi:hypothetical protein
VRSCQQLRWTDDRNVRIDYRWGAGDSDLNCRNAAELVTLAPDVILATGTPTLEPLDRATRVRYWPIATFAALRTFGRYRGIADSGKPNALQIYGFTA